MARMTSVKLIYKAKRQDKGDKNDVDKDDVWLRWLATAGGRQPRQLRRVVDGQGASMVDGTAVSVCYM